MTGPLCCALSALVLLMLLPHACPAHTLRRGMCDAVEAESRSNGRVIDLAVFTQHLQVAQFSGKALFFDAVMEPRLVTTPLNATALLSETVPFGVAFGNFSDFLDGHACNSKHADCAAIRRGHACLPGPPNDGTKIVLKQLYGQ